MSQEQNRTQLDKNVTSDESTDRKKWNFANVIVSILVLMMIAVCIVMLVQVIQLGKKVDGLEESIQALRDTSADIGDTESFGGIFEIPNVDASMLYESEDADIEKVAKLENSIVWDGAGDRSSGIKKVYLTFDDGPSQNTDKILDILDQYGVKATFFVVGKKNYEKQYKRIVEDGHTLGMHSYSHKYKEIYASLDAYKQDLMKLHDFLYELTGTDCNIVRFPGGSSNTISQVDMKELIAYLDEENMIYFDWNVSGGDAMGDSVDADQIAKNVLDNIDKYNNVVILFHDAAGKKSTVDALPQIIEKILASENTVMLPISEDTVQVQHLH